jgi:flagellar basal-body rod modification protein FlgD
MSTTAITSTGSPAANTQSTQTKSLGKDDFLKLFVAQMQHQDPSNPMSDTDSMAQMAQFSTLEQTTNIATANQQMLTSMGMSQALGLLGKTVSYVDDQKVSHTGVVQKVVTEGGSAALTVDGVTGIDPSSVAEVTSTSPSTTTP